MHEKRFNQNIERLRAPDRLQMLEVDRVVKLAIEGMAAGSKVLDIGTGSGVFAEQFASRGMNISGLDAIPEMLEEAKKFVPSGDFRLGIAEDLPFLDGSFDAAFMGLLLHETDDPQKAMNEAFRVIRDRLAVLEWSKEELSYGPPLDDRLSLQEIEQYGKNAGFLKITPINLKYLVLYILEKYIPPRINP